MMAACSSSSLDEMQPSKEDEDKQGDLAGLEVEAVDREEFEADVLDKVERELELEERERQVTMRVREWRELDRAEKEARDKESRCQRGMEALLSEDHKGAKVRRMGRLLKEQELAKEEMEDIRVKRKELREELKALGHHLQEDEEEEEEGEIKEEEKRLQPPEETEMEKSIRLGERTAFGKSLSSRPDCDGGERYRSYVKEVSTGVVEEGDQGRTRRRKKGEPKRRREKEDHDDDDDVFQGNGTDSSDWASTDDEGEVRRKK